MGHLYISALLIVYLVSVSAEEVTKLSVCELESDPARYSGQTVAVRGTVVGRSPLTIFDYEGRGCTQQLLVVEPHQRRDPGGSLSRDDTYNRFRQALLQRTRIGAVFIGRFEFVRRRKKMRLVLHRISDLKVVMVPSVDR